MVVASAPEALLTINDVSKAFPGVKALDQVSLDVRRRHRPRHRRRERGRQVHADEDPVRGLREGQRRDRLRRAT